MFIFRQSMKKMITSWSTWIIIGVAVLAISSIDYAVANKIANRFYKENFNSGVSTEMIIFWTDVMFVIIFIPVFTGFKSVQIFKQEVEDGTFLLILSKPISRTMIIMQKWMAIFIMNFIFATMIFLVIVGFFGTYHETMPRMFGRFESDQYMKISGVFLGVLILVLMLFSSISMLISMFTSSSVTVGISIALGIVIPTLSITSTFTIAEQYNKRWSSLNLNIGASGRKFYDYADEFDVYKNDNESKLTNNIKTLASRLEKSYDLYSNYASVENGHSFSVNTGSSNPYLNSWVLNPQEIIFTAFAPAMDVINQSIHVRERKFYAVLPSILKPSVAYHIAPKNNSEFNNSDVFKQSKLFTDWYVDAINSNVEIGKIYLEMLLNTIDPATSKLVDNNTSDIATIPANPKTFFPLTGEVLLTISSIAPHVLEELDGGAIKIDSIDLSKIYFVNKSWVYRVAMLSSALHTKETMLKPLVMKVGDVTSDTLIDNLKTDLENIANSATDKSGVSLASISDLSHFTNSTNIADQTNDILSILDDISFSFKKILLSNMFESTILTSRFIDDIRSHITNSITMTDRAVLNNDDHHYGEKSTIFDKEASDGVHWIISGRGANVTPKEMYDNISNQKLFDSVPSTYANPIFVIIGMIGFTILLIAISSVMMRRKSFR